MKVTLRSYEVGLAQAAGTARRLSADDRGSQHRYGYSEEDPMGTDVRAVGAELAVLLALSAAGHTNVCHPGLYHPCPGARKLPDLQGDLNHEVRSTVHLTGHLLAHPDDDDEWVFWLVIDAFPDYNVVGFILGADAKQDRFWGGPYPDRPCYFIPQSELVSL